MTVKTQCHQNNYHEICKIKNTHDKFLEAHHFLFMMMQNYHYPDGFRYNMNAFIQALRNITFALQSEKRVIPNFDLWYEEKQQWMKGNSLLRNFVESRNIVVKRGNLEIKSEAHIGLFKYRTPKLGMLIPVNPFLPSEQLLELASEHYVGLFIDEEHSSIGEQCGIQRRWIVDSIGDDEIVEQCLKAWKIIGSLLAEAHELLDMDFKVITDLECNQEFYRVLLETDVNPNLAEEWKWL
ncbi:hypothetical protein [Bacillus atrophaeus]|uniref:hypothetical protein n=1 Tax=Bacillus atrophaeus TaxID=1452 RepID=UPI002E1E2F27|nr:hypothetical protein [Bacillus atrophaeus]